MKRKQLPLLPVVLMIILVTVLINIDYITDYTARLINPNPRVTVTKPNKYATKNNFLHVQLSKDYIPYSEHDLINIFYSILDSGYDNFTFYCPSEYKTCAKDVEKLTQNQVVMTEIGNFVHPFNNFNNIKVTTNSLGEVNVIVKKTYSKEMINQVNNELDKLLSEVITDENMPIQDKILKIHDYIIDNTEYDLFDENKNSGNAYGLLHDKKAKCAGYADVMAIILNRFNVKNFKVASTKHVWNAVYLDDKWQHLDLTWDDPIVENGTSVSETIRHKFYMIDSTTLYSYDTKEHLFDESTYIELKEKQD